MDIISVARVAHCINRAYCQAIGDDSQPDWVHAPDWQKRSAIEGVMFHLQNPEAGPAASHDEWARVKLCDGWRHGPIKDVDAKTHPCLVPFDELPMEQRAKDHLFRGVVHALAPFVSAESRHAHLGNNPGA